MKAIVQDEYGSADVLGLEDVETPVAGRGEVLIRVIAGFEDRMSPAGSRFRLVTDGRVEMGSEESIEVQPRPGGYHITRGGTCNRNAEPAWGWNREPLPGSDAQAARHPVAPRWTPGSDRWCHGRNPGRTPLLRSLSGRPYVDPCIGGLWFGRRHAGGRLLEPRVA